MRLKKLAINFQAAATTFSQINKLTKNELTFITVWPGQIKKSSVLLLGLPCHSCSGQSSVTKTHQSQSVSQSVKIIIIII